MTTRSIRIVHSIGANWHQKPCERKHTMMKKKAVLDTDEDKLIAEYERGAFRSVKHQDRARQEAMEAARRFLRKEARITIR
jgi:hypothetical protein